MQKIVIIGAGLSGTLLTIHLLRLHFHRPLDITVIDRNPPESLGVAYSTDKHFHLLNVPAHKMSAFPDSSEDFSNWLSSSGYSYPVKSFVPRKIYKEYIQDLLAKELSRKGERVRYASIKDKAIDVLPSEQLLVLESGLKLPYDSLVLALGNYKATALNLADNAYKHHPAYFGSAWDKHLFDNLPENEPVLIVGTGLTMVDTVLTLVQREHRGHITALSNHGYTPMSHNLESVPYHIPNLQPQNIDTALEAFKIVNSHLKKARQQGVSWHSVIDAVRPFTQQIWLNLSIDEKKKFMEHLRHIWGVARHRIPQECSATLNGLLANGQLSIVAGRIKSIRENPGNGLCAEYQERSSKKQLSLEVGAIVNCMGPESNYEKLEDAFVRNLLKRALIRPDELQLGIDCTPEGAVIGKDGLPSASVFTIGPPAKGILWEITSVPEIRAAALNLAKFVTINKTIQT